MNSEDEKFVESLNCWEDNYDVITDNIQKLSGLLSLQIQLLQNIQEKKEHERNVRHMTLEEQSISRMLNSFEQRFNVELSKLTNFSSKLDTLLTGQQVLVTRVAQIEEKLVDKEVIISSPISVKSAEGKNEGVDINKHLDDLVNKVQRRTKIVEPGKEEFIKRVTEIDWAKIPGAKISLLDEKGKDIGVKCDIKEDGSVVCEPIKERATIVGWGLKEDVNSLENQVKLNLLPKVNPTVPNKKFIARTIDVFKQQVDTNMFVKVGTITDNVLTLDEPVKEIYVTKPSTYFTDWFVKNTNSELGCQWLDVHLSNTVNEILIKETYTDKFVTTGYLTADGRAVYYDQYL